MWQALRAKLRRPGTSAVVAGSAAAGIGAYLFQVVGLRSLGEEAYAPISVLWTIQYLVLTIALFSVEAYVTRTLTVHHGDRAHLRRPMRVITGWVTGTAAVLGVGTYLGREALYLGQGQLALVMAMTILAAGAFVAVRGVLAGTGRYGAYGAVTATESLARFAFILPLAAIGATTLEFAWSLPIGSGAVALWWALRGRHGAAQLTEPAVGTGELGGTAVQFIAAVTVANAAAQTLLAAGPLVLIPLGASAAEISIFFVTVTAARVPLVFAFGGLLSRLLPPLTRMARAGDDAGLRRLAAIGTPVSLVLALVGGLAGWAIGPAVVAAFFGASSRPGAAFVALTTFGVVLATAALLLNQLLIARGSETRLVVPWLAALAAAVPVVALVDGTATIRVSAGFAVGELVAMAGLTAAVLTAPRLAAPPPAADLIDVVQEAVPPGL